MSVALSPLPTMIYDRALQCLELFQRRAEAETTLAVLRPFEERFWGWANQLKVFSKPHLSIDAQLNHDKFERLRRAISLLLDVLRDNLQLGTSLIQMAWSPDLRNFSIGFVQDRRFSVSESQKQRIESYISPGTARGAPISNQRINGTTRKSRRYHHSRHRSELSPEDSCIFGPRSR
jgi:hypothetical protein